MKYEEVEKFVNEFNNFFKLLDLKKNGKSEEAIKFIIENTDCDESVAKEVFINATYGLADPNEPKPCLPKCPTCGSIDIERINPFEQVASIYLLGIFSNEFNKTFKCNNCGYTW